MRTLKSDASFYASKTSFISAAAEALKKRSHLEAKLPTDQRPFWLGIGSGILLLFLVTGGIFYLTRRPAASPEVVLLPESLIFADEKIAVKLESAERDFFIAHARETLYAPLTPGSFRAINFIQTKNGREASLALADFIAIPGLNLPARLGGELRGFTLGAQNHLGEIHPFLIFKISSFPESFQAALLWEKTMPNDLRLFFKNIPLLGESNALFKDRVIKNQDARVLEEAGKTLLAYSFFNRNLLILTDSVQALGEIITRYAVFPPR